MISGLPAHLSPLSSRASARNAPKIIFVKLDKEKGFQWYVSRSLDVFASGYDTYNHSFLTGGEPDEINVVLYQADAIDEPFPVWLTIRDGKQTVEKFPEKKLILSPVQFLDHHQFASLYLNTETGESGLMTVRAKE